MSIERSKVKRRLAGATLVVFVLVSIAIALPIGADNLRSDSPLSPLQQQLLDNETAYFEAGRANPSPWTSDQFDALIDSLGDAAGTPLRFPGTPAGSGEIHQRSPAWGNRSDSTLKILNFWRTRAGGSTITIYAGSIRADPDQGVVIFETGDRTPASDPRNGLHLTQGRGGALRVISAVGEEVSLVATNGTVYMFDVAEGRFISPF